MNDNMSQNCAQFLSYLPHELLNQEGSFHVGSLISVLVSVGVSY